MRHNNQIKARPKKGNKVCWGGTIALDNGETGKRTTLQRLSDFIFSLIPVAGRHNSDARMPHSPAPWISPPTYDTSYTTTALTPYLQLPHLLSLTWLAYPILSLLFVAFRLQLSLAASQDAVGNAKGDMLTSCQAAEQAATSAASMPRIMAIATNDQFVDAVNSSLNGVRYVLTTALTIMEAIINFIVDLYRSTLLCFLELVVRGGLSIIIGAVQEVSLWTSNLCYWFNFLLLGKQPFAINCEQR